MLRTVIVHDGKLCQGHFQIWPIITSTWLLGPNSDVLQLTCSHRSRTQSTLPALQFGLWTWRATRGDREGPSPTVSERPKTSFSIPYSGQTRISFREEGGRPIKKMPLNIRLPLTVGRECFTKFISCALRLNRWTATWVEECT